MTIEFHVPDMHCEHCIRAISHGVQRVAPDAQVSVDLAAHRVTVANASNPEAVRQAIAAAGYAPARI
ncbi:MAG: heavy-metal-associated domain-containing protein [Burkholderiaceae bacterium]|nr:heavy-metal-associated domain-containing protein [Burkholderiaceae bacterium]